MFKWILCTAALVVLLFWLFFPTSKDSTSSHSKLIVGTNTEYPPYCYIDRGEIVGFDIDVAGEVCKRLNQEMLLLDMPFEGLIPALALHKVDFVAAGMTQTEERSKNVLFTKDYLGGVPLAIISRKESGIGSLEDLLGKKVVVNDGYLADLYMTDLFEGQLNLTRLSSPSDAFIALSQKRVDAFATAGATVEGFFKQNPQEEYSVFYIEESQEGVSLVLPKSEVVKLQEIDQILEEMNSDGTLLALKKKWGFS